MSIIYTEYGGVSMLDATINVKTESKLKKESEELFKEMGLNMSTAINIFLKMSVNARKIPFEIKAPNDYYSSKKFEEEMLKLEKEPNYITKTIEELEAMENE